MKRLESTIKLTYEKGLMQDFDAVFCIVGREGVGKSNVLLHMAEFYHRTILKRQPIVGTTSKLIGIDEKQWITILNKCAKYDFNAFDEASKALNSKDAINRFNKQVEKAYQIIRCENLFSVLVLPYFNLLNPYFRRSRVVGLIHVSHRGKMAFWNKKRIAKICELNKYKEVFNMYVVPPLWVDTFKKYDGFLLSEYKEMKTKVSKDVRQELYDEFVLEKENKQDNPFNKCPSCGSGILYHSKIMNQTTCRKCGNTYNPQLIINQNNSII